MSVTRLDELTMSYGGQASWAPLRRHFGISAFGINAYTASGTGMDVIGEHDELGEDGGRHEELYFVLSGHATFTVSGDEIDAPAGTFVFVRDPAAKRQAVAAEAGTTIVVVGGRPGEAFSPSPWEDSEPGLRAFATGDYDRALEVFSELHERDPGRGSHLYNVACAESRLGRRGDALEHLAQAIAAAPELADLAGRDSDLDAIRDDPRFESALARQTSSGGTSA